MSKITQNQHGKLTYFLSYYLVNLKKMCKNCRKDIKHINISFYFFTKNPQNAMEVL